MIITFFGHSHFRGTAEHKEKIFAFLEKNVGECCVSFYLGGYGEFDEFAYECCKQYKEKHKHVSLIFITPYITVEYQKNNLEFQSKKYDEIIYPEIEDKPLKYAIVYRNRWMIEKSDFVVCGVSHTFGNSYKMYKYAKKRGKRIVNIFDFD